MREANELGPACPLKALLLRCAESPRPQTSLETHRDARYIRKYVLSCRTRLKRQTLMTCFRQLTVLPNVCCSQQLSALGTAEQRKSATFMIQDRTKGGCGPVWRLLFVVPD